MTAQITVKPTADPHPPNGECSARASSVSGCARQRNETCAARETTQDRIIPKNAAFRAAGRLKPADRSVYYAKGYHLMMRDHEGPMVWKDMAAFIKDPEAPLPSGSPKIPTAPPHVAETHVATGL